MPEEFEPHPYRPSSAFRYWKHGNDSVGVNPEPPSGDWGKPFAVCAQEANHIPIFVLVFAHDEEHALRRVRLALAECEEGDYKNKMSEDELAKAGRGYLERNRAGSLLAKIDSGQLAFTATPMDQAVMTRMSWASNDTVCG